MAKTTKGARIRFAQLWTVRSLGIVALLLGILIAIVGYLNQHNGFYLGEFLGQVIQDFYTNVSTDLASIALTVLVIDYLNERRAQQQLKAQLIREMGGSDMGIALRAVSELDAKGWVIARAELNECQFGGS